MESEKYEYVIGSRIRSLPKALKDKILNASGNITADDSTYGKGKS